MHCCSFCKKHHWQICHPISNTTIHHPCKSLSDGVMPSFNHPIHLRVVHRHLDSLDPILLHELSNMLLVFWPSVNHYLTEATMATDNIFPQNLATVAELAFTSALNSGHPDRSSL